MEKESSSKEADFVSLTLRVRSSSSDTVEERVREIQVMKKTKVSQVIKTVKKPEASDDEYDAYLTRSDLEVGLEWNCKLVEYGIRNNDTIELRRRLHPLNIVLNIHNKDKRECQVDGLLPVYVIVKHLCELVGIEKTKELSLALPFSASPYKTMSPIIFPNIKWLNPTESLCSQNIKDGDMLLLRKKFFIFNDDILEAEQNQLLRDLLYNQLQYQLAYAQSERKRKYSSASLLSQDSVFSGEDVTDFGRSHRQSDTATDDDTAIAGGSTSSDKTMDDNQSPLHRPVDHRPPQPPQNKHYPVKSLVHGDAQYLVMQSGVLCLVSDDASADKPLTDGMIKEKWPIEDIKSFETFDNGLKLHVDGCGNQVLFTENSEEIVQHLKDTCGAVSADIPVKSLPLVTVVPVSSGEDDHITPIKKMRFASSVSSMTTDFESCDSCLSTASAQGHSSTVSLSFTSPPPEYFPSFRKKERMVNIAPPEYFGKTYHDLLDNYICLHLIVMNEEIRQILVNIHQPVRLVIRDICATFNIQYPSDHYLQFSESFQRIVQKYGQVPSIKGFMVVGKSSENLTDFDRILDEEKTLNDQMNMDYRPYLLEFKRKNFDEVDSARKYGLDMGEEWPEGEDSGVARYREFYQSWVGVVQGNYPIDKKSAIKLAGLLTYIYYGSRREASYWPPYDYSVKHLLPARYHDDPGMESAVFKNHRKHEKLSLNETMDAIIVLCKDLPSLSGVFFDVKVLCQTELFNVVPWKKLKTKSLGITPTGIVCLSSEKGSCKVCMDVDFSDITGWAASETCFKLNSCEQDAPICMAYSYQAKQIMEVLQIFVKMAYKKALTTTDNSKYILPEMTNV